MDCTLLPVRKISEFIIFIFAVLKRENNTKHIPCLCFGSCDYCPQAVWIDNLYSSIFSVGVQVGAIADCFLPFRLLLSWAIETGFNTLPVYLCKTPWRV